MMVNQDKHVTVAFESVHRMLIVMYLVAFVHPNAMVLMPFVNNIPIVEKIVHVLNRLILIAANYNVDRDYYAIVVVAAGTVAVVVVVDWVPIVLGF